MIKLKKRLLYHIIFSILAASALSLDIGIPDLHMVPEIERSTLFNMPEILWNPYGSLNLKTFPILAVFMSSFFTIVNRNRGGNTKENTLIAMPCFFLSAVFVMAEAFCTSDTLVILFSSSGQLIKTMVIFAGLCCFFYQLTYCFYLFLNHQQKGLIKQGDFWKRFLMILVGWLPYIIILYPGSIAPDSYSQLQQFFGISGWSSHHPPFSSLTMGIIFSIGKVINGNFAVFFYCLMQAIIFALILAHMLELFIVLESPRWLYLLTLFCIFTVPYYTNYIMVVLKDCMYSYCFLLFMVELVYITIKDLDYFKSGRHLFLWVLSVTGTILFRNNGKYAVYPTVILLCIFFIHKKAEAGVGKKAGSMKKSLCAVGYLILPVIIALAVSSMLVLRFDIRKGSIAETLSLPLQQTARYVHYHQDEVTAEEEEVLRSILDYENLSYNYNPRVSDPVKRTFKYNPSYRELMDYFKVWAAEGIKHPETYLAATMNQNYYLFYPLVPNNIVYVGLDGWGGFSDERDEINSEVELMNGFKIQAVTILSKPQKVLFLFYQAYFYLPVIGWFAHPALYTICLICLGVFACIKRLKKWLFVALPVFLSLLIVVLAPAIQRHPRYTFPIIYTVPLMLVYYLYCNRSKTE